jgi:hypothetical protein
MTKAYALDIFDLLNKINDASVVDVYSGLTDEERAAFAPLVTMRWMSGSPDAAELLALNEFVNQYVFSLGKHPHLLMQLLQACSSKKRKRYNWVASKAEAKRALSVKAAQEYLGMSRREVQAIKLPPDEELIKMAESMGWQADEVSKLKKELQSSK